MTHFFSQKKKTPSCILYIYMLHNHDTTTQIYRYREIRNTDDFPLFRYLAFIYFLTFSFSAREERDNFYNADCSYIAHSHPHPSWTDPAQSQISTNCFFQKSPNSQPIASGHDVIHTPVQFPIWGFYYDICDCHILCVRARTPARRAE